jgi:hypothetical protein
MPLSKLCVHKITGKKGNMSDNIFYSDEATQKVTTYRKIYSYHPQVVQHVWDIFASYPRVLRAEKALLNRSL